MLRLRSATMNRPDKAMDDVDRAQEINEAHLAEALDRRRYDAERAIHESPLQCIDCDEPIPEARRKAVPGCRRCIGCQELHENWRPI